MRLPQKFLDRLLQDEGVKGENDYYGIDKNYWEKEYKAIKFMTDHLDDLEKLKEIATKKRVTNHYSMLIEDQKNRVKQHIYCFYNNNFWEPTHCDKLDSSHLSHQLFNLAVNIGQKPAQGLLQEAINEISDIKIKVDGHIGNITAKVSTYLSVYDLSSEFYKKIELYYKMKVEFDENKMKYLNGWLKRANRLNLKNGEER